MFKDIKKIKYRNLKIWLLDQIKRKTWFKNFFITRNAWGAFSINSHVNQHTGKENGSNLNSEKDILLVLLHHHRHRRQDSLHLPC